MFAMPCLVFAQTLTITYDNHRTRTICLLEWPDGLSGQSRLDFIYNIVFLLLTYIVPVTTMVIAYSLMARVLWGSQGIGEGDANSSQQHSITQSKQQVVRMLICVVSVFGICKYYVFKNPKTIKLAAISRISSIFKEILISHMYNKKTTKFRVLDEYNTKQTSSQYS
ncbi:unnamed protein product [Oppiella nova]|uniref:G-protein coupled receptors family 1 profile domain-containing protein n=1 Tax=Oppiella nova TaxID=334625 RepID=A0A7R9LUD4_9ACAR|nr:unnamed protein product [Oppiella nova]CAG2167051.1 unnamed protein product [Oppiella nova]